VLGGAPPEESTLAAYTGATTKELMARLGHASPRAAMIYQHAAADRAIWHESGPPAARSADPRTRGPATSAFGVVGTGVDPVTSRFSGARSAN
jgi:hypothetical protein